MKKLVVVLAWWFISWDWTGHFGWNAHLNGPFQLKSECENTRDWFIEHSRPSAPSWPTECRSF